MKSSRDHLLLGALLLSGVAALGYELLWTRLLALALGSETLGWLGALAGFFGGLALGSFLLHDRVRRARNPARFFAALEVCAALFALASPYFLYGLARHLPPLIGPAAGDNDHLLAWLLAVGIAALALLPGTLPMGATLAALVEARRRRIVDEDDRGLGRLHGANTLGATLGVVSTVFLILPGLGFAYGSALLSAVGICAASLAWLWSRSRAGRPSPAPEQAAGPERDRVSVPPTAWIYATLGITGLAGVGLEVVGVQVLAQSMEDTIYTFSCALAVYLVGTATGAWLFSAWAVRLRVFSHRSVTVALLALQLLTVWLASVVLGRSPFLLDALSPEEGGYLQGVLAEVGVAALVFAAPTLVMGALFSHLMAAVAARGVGRAYALNTLGSTVAPLFFGLFAVQRLGYGAALFMVAVAYAVLLLAWIFQGEGERRPGLLAAAATAMAALALVPRPLHLVAVPEGWNLLFRKPSLYGLVMVTEEVDSSLPGHALSRRLQVNRHFRMGGSASFGERRMGHLPLLLTPDARRALFLGIGTGATLSAIRHGALEHVDAVELVPEVLESMAFFEHVNEGVARDPRVELHAADARRFTAASRDEYDIIVADLFHPARDGAGSLYSREHFQIIAERLSDGGWFCQWLPLHQLDEENLRTVIRTFLGVFPTAHSFLGIYNVETPALALLGAPREAASLGSLERVAERLHQSIYESLLMSDLRDLLGAYMLDRRALAGFAGEGPHNTDLEPRVLFHAPRSVYEKRQDIRWGSLQALLEWKVTPPTTWLADDRLVEEVEGFSRALRHYLEGEIVRVAAGPAPPTPAAAIDSYLAAFQAAPEFSPSIILLEYLAVAEPDRAEQILEEMLRIAPERERTHRVLLHHLRQSGDVARAEQALAQARGRFGPDFSG